MKYFVIEGSLNFNIDSGIISIVLSNQEKDLYIEAQYSIDGDNVEVLKVCNNNDGLEITTNVTQRNSYSSIIKDYFMNLVTFNDLVDEFEENHVVDKQEYREFMLEEYKREERYG